MSEIEEISQKLLGKEFPTEINGAVNVLMYWMKGEMARTQSFLNKKNIKLLKDISKLKKEISYLKDRVTELEETNIHDDIEDTKESFSEDETNTLKSTTSKTPKSTTSKSTSDSKGKLFRKRKVRVPKNAKHLVNKDKSPKSSSDEETKKKKKKNSKILVTQYNDACLIHGSTYEHRDVIKKYHGKWTKDMKGWIVPKDLKDELTGELKTYIINIIENKIDENLEKKQPNMNTSYIKTNSSCLIDSDSD